MTPIKQKIVPMLWFDNEAEDAVNFYINLFPNGKILRTTRYGKEGYEIHGRPEGSLQAVEFELDGHIFSALNGGPQFRINPSVSFFVTLEDEADVDAIWSELSAKGKVLVALDKYDWSPKYGWVEDRYGVSWQVALGKKSDVDNQPFVTSFLFVNEQYGKTEKAINFYTSIFKISSITGIVRAENESPEQKKGTVIHAQFRLENQTFMAMDSGLDHDYGFNEAISMMVYCANQDEVDYYWENLGRGGDPGARVCGWLKDQFGVSWQVVPMILEDMLQDPDKAKTERVTKAFMQMQKMDIATLEKAYRGL